MGDKRIGFIHYSKGVDKINNNAIDIFLISWLLFM